MLIQKQTWNKLFWIKQQLIMGRIFDSGRGIIDLRNIKYIDIRECNNDDCYVRIHLLKGYEYVFNSDTEATELIVPKIEIYFSENRWAYSFIESITEEWEKYLESKEIDKKEK